MIHESVFRKACRVLTPGFLEQVCSVLDFGTTVVVSPLISLMQDQVQLVCNLGDGVSAACLFSGQSEEEALSIYRELHKPHPLIQMVFLTPERLSTASLQSIFGKLYDSVCGAHTQLCGCCVWLLCVAAVCGCCVWLLCVVCDCPPSVHCFRTDATPHPCLMCLMCSPSSLASPPHASSLCARMVPVGRASSLGLLSTRRTV